MNKLGPDEAARIAAILLKGTDRTDYHGKVLDDGEWYIVRAEAGVLSVWHMRDHDEAMTLFREFDRELQKLIDLRNASRQ